MNPVGDGQPVQISQSELQSLQQNIEQEMNMLTDAVNQLQAVQQHFLGSQDASKQMEQVKEGDDILVPLCDGLMVRGKAMNPDWTLVDIGAGYFVQMTQEKCREYCKRRLDFVNTQLISCQDRGKEKFAQRQQLIEIQRQVAQMRIGQTRTTTGN